MQETADKLFGSRSLQVDQSKLGTMGSSMIILYWFSPYFALYGMVLHNIH